jgi:radical SAM protein with 4Fe4S-binding SPASM domain
MFEFEQIKVLVTSGCNSDCTHCFRKTDKNKYILPESKLRDIVDFAIRSHTKQISFSGGEFFTHPYAYALLEYCFERGISVKVLTNATEIDMAFFEKHRGLSTLSFQVSVDGVRENHDLRRGAGKFDSSIANIKKLYELGFSISGKMVMDAQNYKDIVDVLEIPYFNKVIVLPVSLSAKEYSQSSYEVEAVKEFEDSIKLIYKNKIGFAERELRKRILPHLLAVDYEGRVYPSGDARQYGVFCMGSLFVKDMADILNEYTNSEEGRELLTCSPSDIEECNACEMDAICNRGDRVRAYRFHGELLSPDPFCCRIFLNKYSNIPMPVVFRGEKYYEAY